MSKKQNKPDVDQSNKTEDEILAELEAEEALKRAESENASPKELSIDEKLEVEKAALKESMEAEFNAKVAEAVQKSLAEERAKNQVVPQSSLDPVIAAPAVSNDGLPKKVRLLKPIKFTTAMPSRPDIAVKINLKENETVNCQRLIKHLVSLGASFEILE